VTPSRAPTAGLALLVLAYAAFVSLGLPDSVLGAAWPALRAELALPLDAAGPLVLCGTAGVVVSSVLAGRLLARVRTGSVLAGSTLLAAAALLGFAAAPSYAFMFAAALVAGLGGGAIDATINGFAARAFSVRHMNWLHGCWGVGATLGPLAVSGALAAGRSWRAAYALLAAVEVTLALAFLATGRRWRTEDPAGPAAGAPETRSAPAPEAARGPVRASIGFFFVYGGVEAAMGLWGASFLVATKGASPQTAAAAVSVYWGALMVGRFLLGALAARLGPARLVRGALWGALAALVLLAWPGAPLPAATGALGALGLALAPLYPSLMHDTPRRFGAEVAVRLAGYQVAAASLGVATLPWLLGILGRRASLAVIPAALAVGVVALLATVPVTVTAGSLSSG
jgi:fucose permease